MRDETQFMKRPVPTSPIGRLKLYERWLRIAINNPTAHDNVVEITVENAAGNETTHRYEFLTREIAEAVVMGYMTLSMGTERPEEYGRRHN